MADEQLVDSFSKRFNSFIIGGQKFLTALESIQTNCLDFPNSLLKNFDHISLLCCLVNLLSKLFGKLRQFV